MLAAEPNHHARCFFSDDVNPEIWGVAEPREVAEAGHVEEVLEVDDLQKLYGGARKKYFLFGPEVQPPVRAVEGVDFKVGAGRTLGIVGESGSGKSTVARTIVGLIPPNRGRIELHDSNLAGNVEDRTDDERAAMRMVFQNPTSSLNPKLPIRHTLTRALQRFAGVDKSESRQRAADLLLAVGLDPTYLDRPPGELSGGEQQRVAMAGAFAANPEIIVADEAVSSLDVSVQAQVLNLLEERQKEAGNSYVFITHDLGVVRYVSDDILVLYAGNVAEYGPRAIGAQLPITPLHRGAALRGTHTGSGRRTEPDSPVGCGPHDARNLYGLLFRGTMSSQDRLDLRRHSSAVSARPGLPDHTMFCHIPIEELAEIQQAEEASATAS